MGEVNLLKSRKQRPVKAIFNNNERKPFCLFVCIELNILNLSGHSHAGSFLQLKNRNRSARDVCDTFATHAGLVDDVTDTDCCAGANWQPSLTVVFLQTFRHRFLTHGAYKWKPLPCYILFVPFLSSKFFGSVSL